MAIQRGNWQIQIGASDPGAPILADFTEGVKAEPVNGGNLVQEEALAFGAEKKFYDRGNFSATRVFTILREFPDNKQSNDFFQTAAQTYNGVNDVLISFRNYGATKTTYKISAAKVMLVVEEPIGPTCVMKLTVTGGKAVLQPDAP